MNCTCELIETLAQGARHLSREERTAARLTDKVYLKIDLRDGCITFWEKNDQGGWMAARLSTTHSIEAKERLRAFWSTLPSGQTHTD